MSRRKQEASRVRATERAQRRRIAAAREKYQLSHIPGNCRHDFNVGIPLPWAGEKHRGSYRGDEKAVMLRESVLRFLLRRQVGSIAYSQAKECDAAHCVQRRPTTALWSAQNNRFGAPH